MEPSLLFCSICQSIKRCQKRKEGLNVIIHYVLARSQHSQGGLIIKQAQEKRHNSQQCKVLLKKRYAHDELSNIDSLSTNPQRLRFSRVCVDPGCRHLLGFSCYSSSERLACKLSGNRPFTVKDRTFWGQGQVRLGSPFLYHDWSAPQTTVD